MHPLDRATALVPGRDGSLLATLDRAWWGDRSPHGGFLSALLLNALRTTVDAQSRPVRSLFVQFIDPVAEGVATLVPVVAREGRSVTTASVRMEQDDRVVAVAHATFGAARASIDFDDSSPPAVKYPEDLEVLSLDRSAVPPFLSHLEFRPAVGKHPFTGADRALLGGWARLQEPRVMDDLAVAMLMDAWAPSVWPRMTAFVGTPTVDLSIHFVRPLPLEDAAPDDHYLGVFHTDVAHQGYFSEDGALFARDGRLVARSRQLALLIPVG